MSPTGTSHGTPFFRICIASDPTYDVIRRGDNEFAREARERVESLWRIAALYVDDDIRRGRFAHSGGHAWPAICCPAPCGDCR